MSAQLSSNTIKGLGGGGEEGEEDGEEVEKIEEPVLNLLFNCRHFPLTDEA